MGLLLPGLAAGLLVGLCGWLAGHSKSGWAAFVAAAPLTPTLAVLTVHGLEPDDLQRGLPAVLGATLTIGILLALKEKAWMPNPLVLLVFGIPVLVPLLRSLSVPATVAAIIGICLLLEIFLAAPRALGKPRRLPWYVTAALGGLLFSATLAAISLFPAVAPILAVYPVLLIVSTMTLYVTSGVEASWTLLRSCLGANAGVAAFIVVPALLPERNAWAGLGFAWLSYVAVAFLWPILVRAVRPQQSRVAVPSPSRGGQ